IFPNPATNYISIDKSNFAAENIRLRISDVSGKEVLYIPNITKNTVNISHLASGLYFVNMNDGRKKMSKKLIIE
ncbi:MAG: T9SS type A sorting domain-containing protein, partial [Bacteroidota bacterium]|nr:T9SS type A sorting domain-containing protein [Bacteroidota bacterium]